MEDRRRRGKLRCFVIGGTVALGLLGCGGSVESSMVADDGPADAWTAPADARATPACGPVEGPEAGRSVSYGTPKTTVGRGEELTAVVKTSCGDFSIALDAKRFPTTVNLFVFLAGRGFYDGLRFDRAGAGRYLEGGNPPGKGDTATYPTTSWTPEGFIFRQGVVAMVPAGVELGKSKGAFFVVIAKPWLDVVGSPLGTIEDGFDVLDEISQLGPGVEGSTNLGVLGPIGKLRRPVVIEKISIEKG